VARQPWPTIFLFLLAASNLEDCSMTDETPGGPGYGGTRPAYSPGRILAVVVPIALVGLATYWWSKSLESKARHEMASNVVGRMFMSEVLPTTGRMSFPDEDRDLVADPPSDPAKQLKPEVLVFSYVAAEEGAAPDEAFTELTAAIAAKTGKEVKIAHYKDAEEQLAAMQKGELHIAGVNTGLVPAAVEQAGFVPFCTLGRADGSFGYTMEFLVPAGSRIKKPEDIKGHKVTFTRLDSNSGCKAPLVVLKEQYNLVPERDYQWGFSLGHEDSIERVAAKELEVAPVASDILARMIENKQVDPAAVVSIYKSERFPPATIGYVYNLAPELRDAIRETLLKFDWKGTGLEKQFGPEGKDRFVEVSYKDDWAKIAEARKANASTSGT
jgi:phosphonate transport system substrate-binding protein